EKNTRNKASFSTYGTRVDCHAEGDWQIYTTGYGDLYSTDGENYYYTDTFAGTSGASPIVTGAAVALSSMLWIYNGSIYAPKEMRDLLRRDGTPQASGGHIGPRPDLRKQVEHMTNRHLQMESTDFDGDGKSDYAIFRPSDGRWYIRYATGATAVYTWGSKGDIPCPADVNNDGRAELIVFRPWQGRWYIRYWNGSTTSIVWGAIGDIPIPLDYDGDGRAELAVYRWWTDNQGRWYIRYWNGTSTMIPWGVKTDTPLSRDIDGDGRDDLIVFRTNGKWFVRYAAGGYGVDTWGTWGDIPLCYRASSGNWNIAVWRPSAGMFFEKVFGGASQAPFYYGVAGDIPRYADTNGNNWDEATIYRPSNGRWYNTVSGVTSWGAVGDIAATR
ncbi:FG-GAP repeat protein, partial [delta proteobacterium NaphS2]